MRSNLVSIFCVVLTGILIAGDTSCKKPEEIYRNFNSIEQDIGIHPRFDTRHQILQLGNEDYLLCGSSSADSAIFVAHLNADGHIINLNVEFGIGSGHQIVKIPHIEDQYLFLGSHKEEGSSKEGFFSVVINSDGAPVDSIVYFGQEFDEIGLREYAKAYAVIPTQDSGFFFTGGFKQTISSTPRLFGLKVDAQFNTQWKKTYRSNAVGIATLQTDGGELIITASTNPSIYLIAIDNNNGAKLSERTLFQTVSRGNEEALLTDKGTIAVVSTTQVNSTEDIYFIECSFDSISQSFEILNDLFIGSDTSNEYGHQIIQSRDGGFVILGVDDEEPNALILQHITSSRTEGWQERYPGGNFIQPGDIVQTILDFGFFCFGISEQQEGNYFHMIKTDEVGKTEEKL